LIEILRFFESNQVGLLVLLACVGIILLAVQWLAWILGIGRFKGGAVGEQRVTPQNLRYLVTEALTKIINDFRHLLALIIVVIFGLALAYSLYQASGDIDKIKEALQAVAATLGGLVGSIIGYYFGESKGLSTRQQVTPPVITAPSSELDISPTIRPKGAAPNTAQDDTKIPPGLVG
jgi:hypothetical protein